MLDNEEFKRVASFYAKGPEGDIQTRLFGAVVQGYERITGFRESNPNAIYHHCIALYGPACRYCGRPLRARALDFADLA